MVYILQLQTFCIDRTDSVLLSTVLNLHPSTPPHIIPSVNELGLSKDYINREVRICVGEKLRHIMRKMEIR